MSVARGSQNAGHYYSNIVMPQEVAMQFVVNQADTGGLGITSLKSNGWVRNVFMNTSQTPGTGTDSVTNPNPAAGNILIQLKQNFNVFYGMNWTISSVVTGSALTSTTNHVSYQIVSTGTTTAAQWIAAGVPRGVTAAAGVSFNAIQTASIGGTGTVKALTNAACSVIQVVGSPVLSNNSDIAANGGTYVLLQTLNSSLTLANPTDTAVLNIRLFYDRSSVTVDGL